MKKVLIIGYFWPYRGGGADCIFGLAKYLPEFGWQPIILTAPLHERPDFRVRVIETEYRESLGFWKRLFRLNPDEYIGRELRKRFGITYKNSFAEFLFKLGGAIVDYPDLNTGWKPFAVKAGSELLQNEDIDAMISISPVTSHIIAKELKIKYKIPWIADFPDLWSQNHNYGYGPLRKLIDRRLELKTLLPTNALVAVSKPWAEKLKALHKGKTTYAIIHGFDPAEMSTGEFDLTPKFTITYTGTIYMGKQDPSKLFAALQDLISDGFIDTKDVVVRFYGHEEGWLKREIDEYRLSTIVKQYGRIPRKISFEKQKESQLLLLLNWENQQEKGVVPMKSYEYLAATRPILATGGSGDDVVKEILDETDAGMYGSTVEDIKNILRKLYSEYKLTGKITYKGDRDKINKYSYREMARKFAEILDGLT
jgi:glycosyltransferase involved in cell wall biosynthesis